MTAPMVDTHGSLLPIKGTEPMQVPDLVLLSTELRPLAGDASCRPVTGAAKLCSWRDTVVSLRVARRSGCPVEVRAADRGQRARIRPGPTSARVRP
jgi:hypothetical protein